MVNVLEQFQSACIIPSLQSIYLSKVNDLSKYISVLKPQGMHEYPPPPHFLKHTYENYFTFLPIRYPPRRH